MADGWHDGRSRRAPVGGHPGGPAGRRGPGRGRARRQRRRRSRSAAAGAGAGHGAADRARPAPARRCAAVGSLDGSASSARCASLLEAGEPHTGGLDRGIARARSPTLRTWAPWSPAIGRRPPRLPAPRLAQLRHVPPSAVAAARGLRVSSGPACRTDRATALDAIRRLVADDLGRRRRRAAGSTILGSGLRRRRRASWRARSSRPWTASVGDGTGVDPRRWWSTATGCAPGWPLTPDGTHGTGSGERPCLVRDHGLRPPRPRPGIRQHRRPRPEHRLAGSPRPAPEAAASTVRRTSSTSLTSCTAGCAPRCSAEDVAADVELITVDRDASMYAEIPPNTWTLAFGWFMHAIFELRYGFPFHPQPAADLRVLPLQQARPAHPRGHRLPAPVRPDRVPRLDHGRRPALRRASRRSSPVPDHHGQHRVPGHPRAARPPDAQVAYVDVPADGAVPAGADLPPQQTTRSASAASPRTSTTRMDLLETYRRKHPGLVTSRLHCYLPGSLDSVCPSTSSPRTAPTPGSRA